MQYDIHTFKYARVFILSILPFTILTLDNQVVLSVRSCTHWTDDEAGAGSTLRVVILPLTPKSWSSFTASFATHTPKIKRYRQMKQPFSKLKEIYGRNRYRTISWYAVLLLFWPIYPSYNRKLTCLMLGLFQTKRRRIRNYQILLIKSIFTFLLKGINRN